MTTFQGVLAKCQVLRKRNVKSFFQIKWSILILEEAKEKAKRAVLSWEPQTCSRSHSVKWTQSAACPSGFAQAAEDAPILSVAYGSFQMKAVKE